MEMVAHDMRSPLSAVSLSLAVFDKSDGEKINQEAKPLLTQGTENVERLIALVNDLLTLEKLAANVTEVTAVGVESFEKGQPCWHSRIDPIDASRAERAISRTCRPGKEIQNPAYSGKRCCW